MSLQRVCFVACVEAGRLELETIRLAESLRRWGGSLAQSELLAIVPRLGPPLARTTRRRLDELGVKRLRVRGHPGYAWYHYMNKLVALAAAEEVTDAPLVAFMDSDVIIAGEPSDLRLPPEVQFAACVPDTGVVGTSGPESANDPHWARICEVLRIEIDELPWVRTAGSGTRIRMYFNSGVFVYRREAGLLQTYSEFCTRILDAGVGFPGRGEHYFDQICLGLAVFDQGLAWRGLPFSHNYTLLGGGPDSESSRSIAAFRDARVLHYHDSMRPAHWERLLSTLATEHAEVHDWLAALGPTVDRTPIGWRVMKEALRVARGVPRRRYRRRTGKPGPAAARARAPSA